MKVTKPTDEDRINNQYSKLISDYSKSASSPNTTVKDNPKNANNAGDSPVGVMGSIRTWTKLLESMDIILSGIGALSDNVLEESIDQDGDSTVGNQDELIDQLNKIFTPVLIMQGFENDAADHANAEMAEAGVLNEKSIIKFDDDTRMAQLIAVCSRLIARQKNTEQYQMYAKAHKIKKAMDLEMQKLEHDAAKALANAYLINVSTTNSSPVARKAATALMPATQH